MPFPNNKHASFVGIRTKGCSQTSSTHSCNLKIKPFLQRPVTARFTRSKLNLSTVMTSSRNKSVSVCTLLPLSYLLTFSSRLNAYTVPTCYYSTGITGYLYLLASIHPSCTYITLPWLRYPNRSLSISCKSHAHKDVG